jgi:hypothetical protein
MNWIEYLPLAEKTLSTQFNCEEEFYQRILHAVIGSLTEVEELLDNYTNGELTVDVNKQGSVAEESADIFWYLSILYRELDIRNHNYDIKDEFKLDSPFNTLLEFTKLSLKFLDLLKKKIYYNKEISKDVMIDYTIKLHSILVYYCHLHKADISTILEKNIQKLKSRYGDKFTSEKAINRDLKTEREILEGNSKAKENFDTGSLYLDGMTNHRRRSGTSQHYLD